jgi:hypothetical protein
MTVSLKHNFVSAVADGGDTSLVRPSNWNAEHDLTMATGKLLGRTTAGTGAAEEISAGTGLSLSAGSLTNAGVTSFSAGTTGFTPSTGTTGDITLAGTLAVANGGTGAVTLTGYVKGNGTSAFTASATIPASDISSGAALTKADDTNVTLTLGGAPSTALLAATSLTLGWSGTLSVARGGTNATATPTAGAVAYGTGTAYAFTSAGTAGQVLLSNGSSAPSFGGVDGGTF